MDEATITIAYSNLLTEMQNHQKAAEHAALVRASLDLEIMIASRDGLITGKNETERKIAAFTLLEAKHRALAEAEEAERRARFSLEYARVLVEKERALLRLAELTQAKSTPVFVASAGYEPR